MGLGSDDSGAFRVAPAGDGAKGEIRLTPKPVAATGAANQVPASTPAAKSNPIDLKPAANAQVRVTGLPPAKSPPPVISGSTASQPNASGVGAPAAPAASPVNPPRAIEAEGWVRLPTGGQVTLRYSRWAKRVSVSARKLEFPSQCPCCMRAADAQYDAHVAKTRERQNAAVWTFPYCTMCLGHARSARWMRLAARGLGIAGALLVGGIAYLIGGVIAAAIAGISVGLATWAGLERAFLQHVAQRMAASCVCYGPAVRFAEFYGSVQHFDFANTAYAEAFRRANEKKLT